MGNYYRSQYDLIDSSPEFIKDKSTNDNVLKNTKSDILLAFIEWITAKLRG